MGQTQSRASIPAGAGEVEKSTGGENAGHRAAYSQKEAAGGRSGTPEEAKKEQRFRNGHVIFLFSGTKVTPHAAFVKGRFTLRVKNLLCSLRSCGIFYPSPLTNTLCFAGRCLGKKKKCCSLVSVRFVILLPGFVRMVEELPRSVRHVISFCNSRWSVLWYTLRYRFLFAFYMCKGQKPPAKTPPEACYNLFLICYLSPVSRNKEQKPCLWN